MIATATSAEVSRAYRHRRALERGKPLSEAERTWLERYERDHPPARPRAIASPDAANDNVAPAPPVLGPPETLEPAIGPKDIFKANPAAAPSPNVPPPIVVPVDAAPPSAAELQAAELQAAKVHEQAASLARTYCDWLEAANTEVRELGGIGIPTEIIRGLIEPQATELIIRTMPAGALSENAQGAIVLGAGGATVLQRHFLRRRATSRIAAPSSAPAPSSPAAQPPPAPPPPPVASSAQAWDREL